MFFLSFPLAAGHPTPLWLHQLPWRAFGKADLPSPLVWVDSRQSLLPAETLTLISRGERNTVCVVLTTSILHDLLHISHGRLNMWITTEEYCLFAKKCTVKPRVYKRWWDLKRCVLEVCFMLHVLMCLFQFKLKIKRCICFVLSLIIGLHLMHKLQQSNEPTLICLHFQHCA